MQAAHTDGGIWVCVCTRCGLEDRVTMAGNWPQLYTVSVVYWAYRQWHTLHPVTMTPPCPHYLSVAAVSLALCPYVPGRAGLPWSPHLESSSTWPATVSLSLCRCACCIGWVSCISIIFSSGVMHHLLCITCYVSPVMYHLLCITCGAKYSLFFHWDFTLRFEISYWVISVHILTFSVHLISEIKVWCLIWFKQCLRNICSVGR